MSEARRLLIVDNSAADRAVLLRLLHDNDDTDYEVLAVESGAEALQACEVQRPQCLLVDASLADCDRLQWLATLRSSLEHHFAIVMLFAKDGEASAAQARQHAAQDYVIKSDLTAQSLRRAIDNAVEKASLVRALQSYRQEAEDSKNELQQFAYTASHDLRAPLRRIKTFCDLLQSRCESGLEAEVVEFIGYIVASASHMQSLIDALLMYSRAGTGELLLQPIDMSLVVDDAATQLATAIRDSGAEVTRDELPTVRCDGRQMVLLFQNLIDNAITYRGEASPVIHVSATVESNEVCLAVKDNGVGIDPKHHEKIFAAFKRLHGDSEYPGAGMGLATCKRIVQRHQGKIWVESQPGAGSKFCFTLPLE